MQWDVQLLFRAVQHKSANPLGRPWYANGKQLHFCCIHRTGNSILNQAAFSAFCIALQTSFWRLLSHPHSGLFFCSSEMAFRVQSRVSLCPIGVHQMGVGRRCGLWKISCHSVVTATSAPPLLSHAQGSDESPRSPLARKCSVYNVHGISSVPHFILKKRCPTR